MTMAEDENLESNVLTEVLKRLDAYGYQSWTPLNRRLARIIEKFDNSYIRNTALVAEFILAALRGIPPPEKRHYNPISKKSLRQIYQEFRELYHPTKDPPVGWCSWHTFGLNISHDIIVGQAEKAIELASDGLEGLNCILIDDGWTKWGDWLESIKEKFPQGIEETVRQLQAMGLQVGLWWAPYMAVESSNLYKSHPDWFIPNHEGTQYGPTDIFIRDKRRVLDYRKPEVQEYIDTCMKRFQSMGVTVLKSDFLYAGHTIPEYKKNPDPPDTHLIHLLQSVREAGMYSIACGCPLEPAAVAGVDAMRIGPDINIPPLQKYPFFNRRAVSVRLKQLAVAAKWRLETDLLWHLDPDALITDPGLGVTPEQAKELVRIHQLCRGPRFLGDDLKNITPERMKLIREWLAPFPPKEDAQHQGVTTLSHTPLVPSPAMA